MRMFCLIVVALIYTCSASRNELNPCDDIKAVKRSFLASHINAESVESIGLRETEYFFVDCSHRGLTKVPEIISSKVEFLSLASNVIRHVTVGDFTKFTNLTVLVLRENCVGRDNTDVTAPPCDGDMYIEAGTFENLLKLKYLDISSNYLREFQLRLPASITYLDITFTEIGPLKSKLNQLRNLVELHAGYNCNVVLKKCPRNFTMTSPLTPSLKVLDIACNSLRSVPRFLLGDNLTALDLSFNQIHTIRKDDFRNSSFLTTLQLPMLLGPLQLQPGALDPLVHLQHLNLRGNIILHIPRNFFKYNEKLTYLDLSLNCLTQSVYQPVFLYGLNQLKYLDVSTNAVCFFPRANITSLQLGSVYSSLESLNILMIGLPPHVADSEINSRIAMSVKVANIDKTSFETLSSTNIELISLDGCSIQTVEPGSFDNLNKLTRLNAAYNNIDFALDRRFKRKPTMQQHQSIDREFLVTRYSRKPSSGKYNYKNIPPGDANTVTYATNQITSIDKSETVILKNVENLDLSHNQIKVIHKIDLEHFTNLKHLSLTDNPLQKIDAFAFNSLVNLQSLEFTKTSLFQSKDLRFLVNLPPSINLHLRWQGIDRDVMRSLRLYIYYGLYPVKSFDSIARLDFSSNDVAFALNGVHDTVFELFPSLQSISMRNCALTNTISAKTFRSLRELRSIDLSRNNFNQLPTLLLQNLTTLEEIILSYNHISELTSGFFNNLTLVKKFYISNNKIFYIQPGFFNMAKLNRLDLSYNYIQRLDPDIFGKVMLETLVYLDVRWNELDCGCDVWQTFYFWYISDESSKTELPGFMPTCTTDMDEYYGGCVACQSPWSLRGQSVSRHGYNTSCTLTSMIAYAASFTAFIIAFMVSGTIGCSKWFKRMVFRKVKDQFVVKSLKPNTDNQIENNRFHSFVFYDHENIEVGDWVDGRLVPAMKHGEPPIDLVVIGRDDYCGVGRARQVLQRAVACHKTIVLLTNDFCDNPTCRFLITGLQELQFSEGSDRLILVTWYGDRAPRVPELIQRTMNRRRRCFLRFDHANDDERLFFDVLQTHLLSRNNSILEFK